MNWKRTIGLDNLADEYKYGRSESTGYTSEQKIPDHWVKTTCGYCSVGCGIEIGVKGGFAQSQPSCSRWASSQSRQALPQGPLLSTTSLKPKPVP